MFFKLKELPFELNALEPHISRETIEYHYGKHHLGYVNKLNELIVETKFAKKSLEEIMLTSSGSIFNNAAQVWNHDFYWQTFSLNRETKNKEPGKFLLPAIEKKFGTYTDFEKIFKNIALSHFGSGWIWLNKDKRGLIEIINTNNADLG